MIKPNKKIVLISIWFFIGIIIITSTLNYTYTGHFIVNLSIYEYLLFKHKFFSVFIIVLLIIGIFLQYKIYKRKLELRTNCQIQYLELEQIANLWLDDEDIAKNYEDKYKDLVDTTEDDIKANSVNILQMFLSRDIRNKEFYNDYIFPYMQFYSDIEISIILDLLEILEHEASKLPSVATIYKDDYDKKNFKKAITTDGMTSYDILMKVNLYAHTLNVVRFIVEAIKKEHHDNYMFFISKVIIMALAHDLGKIGNIKNVTDAEDFEELLYKQNSHEKMSKLLLISMFPNYEYLDEIVNAIEQHHLPIKDEDKYKEENLLRVLLLKADHNARNFEIKEFHSNNKVEKVQKTITFEDTSVTKDTTIDTSAPVKETEPNGDMNETLQLLLKKVSKLEESHNPENTGELEELKKQIKSLNHEKRLLEEKSIKDAMTRAYNKGYFEENITKLFNSKKNIAIAYMDGDSFKSVNDNYGHDGGDEAIKQMANNMFILTRDLKNNAKVIRFGGDEFVIVFLNSTKEDVLSILENLRTKMESTIITNNNDKFSITISIGVAFRIDSDTPEKFCKRADDALYDAKEKGRNCVAIAKENIDNTNTTDSQEIIEASTTKETSEPEQKKIDFIDDENIDKTHSTTISDEKLGNLIEKLLDKINYVHEYPASGKQKIISITKDKVLYYERQEFIKLLKSVGLETKMQKDLEAIYIKLVNDGLVIGKSVTLNFTNTTDKMPKATTTTYVPIKADILGLSADDLALSKRNEPLLRNVDFSF